MIGGTTQPRRGQVALVTGAAQGLGYSIACRLGLEGATVAVNDIDGTRSHRAASHLRSLGIAATAAPADVADERAVVSMIDQVVGDLGPVTVLINNAAALEMASVATMSDEVWDRTLDVNLIGTINCCTGVLGSMRTEGRGWIVNVSSIWGLVGARGASAYCASKGAIVAWTAGLAERLLGSGIAVSAVAPGPMDTLQLAQDARFAGVAVSEIKRRYRSETLLGRIADPEEIAAVVSRLASPAGASFHGQTLAVTGGRGD